MTSKDRLALLCTAGDFLQIFKLIYSVFEPSREIHPRQTPDSANHGVPAQANEELSCSFCRQGSDALLGRVKWPVMSSCRKSAAEVFLSNTGPRESKL